MKSAITIAIAALTLNGCASIVTGSEQSLSVNTPNVPAATCDLTNDKGTWYIPATPASVTVHRSYSPLNITCKKDGYNPSSTSVASSTKGMMMGNILAGGIIGGAIDAGTGAGYDYPTAITMPMTPLLIPNPVIKK